MREDGGIAILMVAPGQGNRLCDWELEGERGKKHIKEGKEV